MNAAQRYHTHTFDSWAWATLGMAYMLWLLVFFVTEVEHLYNVYIMCRSLLFFEDWLKPITHPFQNSRITGCRYARVSPHFAGQQAARQHPPFFFHTL